MSIELIANSSGPVGEDTDGSLLASKFIVPPPLPFMVARPALVSRIAEGVQGPLTLVSGVAGSGKTELLASWARSGAVRWPIVWITVEPGDDQSSTFWMYVAEGLRRAGGPVPVQVPVAPGAIVSREFLSGLAATLSAWPTPVVLVLDGVSQLPGPDWATGLDFLLGHARNLRIVLSGRWDPPLPLYRYRLAGRLHEIRTADLAFRPDEAARLLELHGMTFAEGQISRLLEQTEGWAAGIRLCALALQNSADPERLLPTLTGQESSIAEYFLGEVLRSQPPPVRRFLLETSVLETFTPELAAATTGRADAGRMLSLLTRENAFIQPVGDDAGLYRYHRLFADLLRAQLIWAEPDEITQLHQRAAEWLVAHGRLADAAAHCRQAGDWQRAATMVIEDYAIGQLVIEGSRGRLGGVFASLPEDLASAETVLVSAALSLGDGDHRRAAEQFGYANKLLAADDSECADGLNLAFHLIQLLTLGGNPDPEQVEQLAPVAWTFLAVAPERRLARHPELRMLVGAAEGVARLAYSVDDRAVDLLAEAIATAPPGAELVKIDCLARLSVAEAYRGRLGRAETIARRAVDLAGQCGLGGDRWPAAAEVALAWVALERYDIEAADRHLRAAHPLCAASASELATGAYAVVKGRRLQIRGETRQVLNLLAAAAEAADESPRWLSRELVLGRVRLLTAAGRTEEAADLLARLPDHGTADAAVARAALLMAQGRTGDAHEIASAVARAADVAAPVVLDAWLLLARLASDDDVTARDALRHALQVAAPESYRRPVHQVWSELRRLLRDEERLSVQHRVLGAGPPAATQPIVVEALSKREFDVLRGMADMLPTEEIAASMYVSVNTVKTHVRNILRKLSASRRNEAVRRARALKLI